MSNRVLDIRSLYVGYDGSAVVRDLTLHVDAGEVVVLLGPNGAGKTTLLLTIGGMIKPIKGHVEVMQKPLPSIRNAHLIAHRGVSHVPEDRGIFSQLTVKDNILLALAKDKKTALLKAVEMFPALELLMNRPAGLLSGGEQQMLSMARAVLSRPALILIDELSLGLAPVIYKELIPSVRRIANEIGCGVLFVEQHIELALAQADRGYVLYHGDLVMQGTAKDLISQRDRLDRAFLGSH
ncbi:ABC transporter ATP-binding protein [Pseudomonas syringae group genomosp. 3]|uniref:ABC transporter ATP-binding protein n=1 Tax=Pseudomonas syringae group genomosp. 3 TaxID=251701 RepID=UPI000F00A8D7|nr:ATP-binding cassette domain-containing protein [Pseudomonas syringae group genomosp. 3]